MKKQTLTKVTAKKCVTCKHAVKVNTGDMRKFCYHCRKKLNERGLPMQVDSDFKCEKWEKCEKKK